MRRKDIVVRRTRESDFPQIISMCEAVYPESGSWSVNQLKSHLSVFPEGQLVAVHEPEQTILGMASSLIVVWEDYDSLDSWRDFTDHGMFTNHDPEHGRTLYGAEVMVRPSCQGKGVGSSLYRARFQLVESLKLRRVRAGARLRGYHRYADQMSAESYVAGVIRGSFKDPTLSFQLKHGFEVLAVVPNYLKSDPESRGWAALIEWLNPRRVDLDTDSRSDSLRQAPDPAAAEPTPAIHPVLPSYS